MAKPVLVALAALVLTAGCQTSDEPRYAVRLSVSGDATPIKDLAYESFIDQSFDDACRITTTPASPNLAIAGPVGSTVSVGVEVSSCRQDTTEPAVTCSWKVVPRRSVCAPQGAVAHPAQGQAKWSGWSHQAALQVPDRTGIYDVTLACEVDGGEQLFEPIESTLYATYREPLFMVSPPQRSWYARATEWGCGFTAKADEKRVLKHVLDSLYANARGNWRYGVFELADPAAAAYPPYDEGGNWFNCPWQALVDESDPCNFADCFEYSQVFEHISATLGIGVFEPIADVGNAGEGFKTVADSYSLDPRFPGNVDLRRGGRL